METLQLKAVERDKSIKAKNLLLEKKIPVEYYGKGVENLSLQVDASEFRRLFKKAGFNTVINIEFNGKEYPVLVHDVSNHPLSDDFLHVDFKSVKMDEEVETTIPLEFVGTSIAVKDFSGTFINNFDELEVKCLPKYLVNHIDVDISVLTDFNTQITIADLKIPEGIEIMHEPEESVCTVVPPRVEEEKPAEEVAESATETAVEGAKDEKKE